MAKLITEVSSDLVLEKTTGQDFFITGLFSTADEKNNNGRIYKKELLEREINRLNEGIKDGKSLFGELGHPEGPTVNLDRVSHKITDFFWKENHVFGKAKILNTPMGKTARELLKEGSLGISSRGLGDIDEDGTVKENLHILTYDLVDSPSNQGSYVNGILEGKEFQIPGEDQDLDQMIEKMDNYVNSSDKKSLKELYYPEKSISIDSIKKDQFRWTSNESYRQIDSSKEKIDKSIYKWGKDGFGGQSVQPIQVVFFERLSNKVLYSNHPFYPERAKLSESDFDILLKQGFKLVPWSTNQPNWRKDMMKKINRRHI